MKALIIDDEERARNLLTILIQENCPQVTAIKSTDDLPKGVDLIHEYDPDIVFLDIEMPEYSGIQLFDFIAPSQVRFGLVFTTAYSEYAIKAFELNAIDYLLKPLRDDQVAKAVEKVIQHQESTQVSERLEELRNTLRNPTFKKVGLPVADGVLFVKFDDIVMFEADRMYTKVHIHNQGVVLVSKPMKFFIDAVKEVSEFYRPHRSFLINLRYLQKYVSKNGGYIVMDNGAVASVSREKRDEFFNAIQGI